MDIHRFSSIMRPAFALLVACVFVAAAIPGGFMLRVEQPSASSGDAVLHIRTLGCNQPAKAQIVGKAEGIVYGQRVSVPLILKSIEKGVFAVAQQWPTEGSWVLAVTGTYNGHISSVLVEMGTGQEAVKAGKDLHVRTVQRALSSSDIEGALQNLTANRMTIRGLAADGDF